MRIGIVSDHRGFLLKEKIKKVLLKSKYEIIDLGTNSTDVVDFPKYAYLLTDIVNKKEVDFGIAICGTGIGMSIACNKVKGIYCAKVSNKEEARLAKAHNHANILAISSKISVCNLKKIIFTFIETKKNTETKYINRINQIKGKENND